MFRGTFTALVTPFATDGAIDENGFTRLVERQLAARIDGVVLFTGTGEPASLSPGERRRLVEIIQRRAEGHLFLWAGVFATHFEDALALAREMDWLGVDALFCGPSRDTDTIEHFHQIAEAVSTPLLLSNASATLTSEAVALLSENDAIRGLVDASGDLSFVSRVLATRDEEFAVLAGIDTLAGATIALGADGAMSVVSNVIPERVKVLVDAALAGAGDEAPDWHEELFALLTVDDVAASAVSIKAALTMMGLIEARSRPPLVPLAKDPCDTLRRVLSELGLDPDSYES